jgi:hypothetical protein
MLTNQIEKLSAGTKIAIIKPRYSSTRKTSMENTFDKYITSATLVSSSRFSRGCKRSDGSGVSIADYNMTIVPSGFAWRTIIDKQNRDYGFWVEYTDDHGVPSYAIVSPTHVLSIWAEYEAFTADRNSREALAQAKREAESQKAEEVRKLKDAAKALTHGNIDARAEALRSSVPKTLVALVGLNRAKNINVNIYPSTEFVEREGAWHYVATSYGTASIPVETLQVLLELALVGKENN